MTRQAGRTARGVVAVLALVMATGATAAERGVLPLLGEPAHDVPLHDIAVELAPVERARSDARTVAHVRAVSHAPAHGADTLDRVLHVAGHLPEPASWGLMILGFGGIAGAMRRRMRRSDAVFTARVRRIAERDGD